MLDQKTKHPITDLEKSFTQPHMKGYNQKEVVDQCRIFLAILESCNGESSHRKLIDATKAAMKALGKPEWKQQVHEIFFCILLEGKYITHNRDMRPEKSGTW